METKDALSSCLTSEAQQMQQIQDKAKKSCMVSFRQFHSHLKRLSQNDLQGSRTESGFKRAFVTLSGQDIETFTGTMFLNVEQLEKQLDKEDFQETGSMAALNVNERQMKITEDKVDTTKALDASSVDTESNRTESKEHDTSSRSGNDAHDDDADIRPIYDEEPMAEVQTTAEISVFAIGQQHTEQPEFNNEVEVVQNAEECHDTFTTHYLPKEREAASTKPHHMIASSNFRISSKNMPRFTSNDMVHNHYLEEAKKKTQECSRNSEPSLMHSARSQSTTNGSKPRPRMNYQNFRNWPAPKISCVTTKTQCVFSANHDSCLTKLLKEVNSRAKVPSNKTLKTNKPVEQISVPNEQERQILTGHEFSIQKTSVMKNKTMNPRSCLRWKSTGKIFKTVGLRWVPTRRILISSTTKVGNEPLNGSNADITNQYECEQTLDGFKEFSSDVQAMTSDHNSSGLRILDHSNEPSSLKLVPNVVPPACKTATSRQELELLFHHHITMLRSTCK
nr:hypothetical protein [Tanacetum cinerariifolium]